MVISVTVTVNLNHIVERTTEGDVTSKFGNSALNRTHKLCMVDGDLERPLKVIRNIACISSLTVSKVNQQWFNYQREKYLRRLL